MDRRELLKLGSISPLLYYLPRAQLRHEYGDKGGHVNTLIVVFDAFSAYHLSLFGHRRETTPHLSNMLDKATVYHNHYAGGPFTTPGTASLLCGCYPWSHRAFNVFNTVIPEYADRNIFSLLPQYHRFAYTQNPVVRVILNDFASHDHIDDNIRSNKLFLQNNLFANFLEKDWDIASLSQRQIIEPEKEIPYSLLFSDAYRSLIDYQNQRLRERYEASFPRGIPHYAEVVENFFNLEKPIDWLQDNVAKISSPWLGYFHFLPPHDPYCTRVDFFDAFKGDGINPIKKPEHLFTRGVSYEQLTEYCRQYDEYILYVDHEFSRLFHSLEQQGVLDDTRLIFTSDHGEMFERGIDKHGSQALFQPEIRVPLMIYEPGQQERLDIYHNTSAVDILPTLLFLAGEKIPDWCEGEVLPPYNTQPPRSDREVFVVHSRKYRQGKPIERASLMIRKGEYKLTKFFGWEQQQDIGTFCEMYDVEQDPEELNDLYSSHKDIADELEGILDERLLRAEEEYLRGD